MLREASSRCRSRVFVPFTAGPDSWEAGFAEAVFRIGEKLSLLFQPRFESIWQRVGIPPGPWAALTQAEEAP